MQDLHTLKKKELYVLALEIAETVGKTGLSKYTKGQLINFIEENQMQLVDAVETVEPVTTVEPVATVELVEIVEPVETVKPAKIPTPQEFFQSVSILETKLEIHASCNELLEILSNEYKPSTVSRKLSEYKKPFYSFQHDNSKFNETVKTKEGTNTQHIAANLLTLSEEQSQNLVQEREKAENKRLAIAEDGEIRTVQLPPKQIKAIIEKACELLKSNNPYDIGCGIMILTGLRRNEQNMPSIQYDELVVREWKVVDEYAVAIKGLSKKSGSLEWFVRATLIPAQVLVEAQNRFLSFPEVQAIPSNYRDYNNGAFRKAFDRRFKKIWNRELSTVEAYDEKGDKISNNATTHKARAFYTWALVPVLKSCGFNINQAKKYVKECLGHNDEKDTSKYFNRYDENQFVEAIEIALPTNFSEIGMQSSTTVEMLHKEYSELVQKNARKITEVVETEAVETEVVETEAVETEAVETEVVETEVVETSETLTFDLKKFIENLSPQIREKFNQALAQGTDLTEAVLSVVKQDSDEKIEVVEAAKTTVADSIEEIIVATMEYNEQQPEIKNILVPSYSAVNRIHLAATGKECARSSYEKAWNDVGRDVTERLENRGVLNLDRDTAKEQGVVSQEMWNGKYHRKDIQQIVDRIAEKLDL